MKREINLHSRETSGAKELHWSRMFYSITAGMLLLLLIGGAGGMQLYRLKLERDVETLQRDRDRLTVEVAPIEAMEAEIRAINQKASLGQTLSGQRKPWSSYLEQVRAAAGDGVRLDLVNINTGDETSFQGSAPAMRPVVRYLENLREFPFLEDVSYEYIRFDRESESYTFRIRANFTGGEVSSLGDNQSTSN